MSSSDRSTPASPAKAAVETVRDRPAEERLLTGPSGRLLAIAGTASMTSMAGRITLSPLLPEIMADLAITPSRAGVALTVMAGVGALLRYPGGRFADVLSRKTIVIAGLGLWIAGFGLLAGTTTYPVFVAATFLIGVGSGLYIASVTALISELFVTRRGLAFGFNTAMINLGGVIASGLAVATLAVATWRAAFLPIVGVLVVTLGLMHRWNPEPYVVSRVHFDVRDTVGRMIGIRPLRRALLGFTVFAFAWQGTVNFLPTFLQLEKGFSASTASTAFASLFVVGMLVNPVAGRLGDRFGYTRIAIVCPLLGAVGLGLIVATDGLLTVALGLVVFGSGLSAFWPVMSAYVMDVIPDTNLGGDYGALATVYIGIGSFGPTFVGVVAERVDFAAAFGVLALAMLGSVVILRPLRRAG